MTDTATEHSILRRTRDKERLSREAVCRLLDPPISTKTLERWEASRTTAPMWRIRQLAAIYRVRPADLEAAA